MQARARFGGGSRAHEGTPAWTYNIRLLPRPFASLSHVERSASTELALPQPQTTIMTNVKAHWTLSSRSLALARSSHCLSVTSTGLAVLYGGELKPRTPVDTEQGAKGAVHVFDVTKKKDDASMLNWHTFCRAASGEGTPEPRVGAATAIIGQTFYLWGGRGGVDLGSPVAGEEIGIWAIDLSDLEGAEWHRLEAANEAEAPEPRSYHTMTSLGVRFFVDTQSNCLISVQFYRVSYTSTLAAQLLAA